MKNFRKYILPLIGGSFVAFLVGKLMDPIFTFCYSKFLDIGTFFIKTFSDSTYISISNGFSEKHSLWVYCFILCISSGLLSAICSELDNMHKSRANQIQRVEQKLQRYETSLLSSADDDDIATKQSDASDSSFEEAFSNSLNEVDKIKNELSDIKTSFNKKKKYFIAVRVLFIISIFFLLFTYAQQLFVNRAITLAMNNIEIVSPYIPDEEYKQLKADFYCIQCKEDYVSLFDHMEQIASDNSISLKK